jgi:hypothetical protein
VFRFITCLSFGSGALLDADLAELDNDGFFTAEFDVEGLQDAQAALPLFCAIYEKKDRADTNG